VRISPDRALYLSRVLADSLRSDPNLAAQVDRETLRRAVTREIGEAARELEEIEEKVRQSVAKRKGANSRDFDLIFARDFELELRKHGA
jgi:hypothetical protein